MPWINQSSQPSTTERVIGGLCYLTFGLLGLLYIIISGRSSQSPFFRFHFLQSIVLGIIGLLLSWTAQVFMSLMGGLLSMLAGAIGPAAMQIAFGLNIAFDAITKACFLLLIYGMLFAFLGKYAEIPFISNLVRRQM
jgi:uncharacterized membrane protein